MFVYKFTVGKYLISFRLLNFYFYPLSNQYFRLFKNEIVNNITTTILASNEFKTFKKMTFYINKKIVLFKSSTMSYTSRTSLSSVFLLFIVLLILNILNISLLPENFSNAVWKNNVKALIHNQYFNCISR